MTNTSSRNSDPSTSLGIFNLDSDTTEDELRTVKAQTKSATCCDSLLTSAVGSTDVRGIRPSCEVQLIRDRESGRTVLAWLCAALRDMAVDEWCGIQTKGIRPRGDGKY